MPVVPGGAWWCLVVPVVPVVPGGAWWCLVVAGGAGGAWRRRTRVRCPLRVLRAASLNSGVVKKEQRGVGARAVC